MKKILVAIDSGALQSGHAVRGIGVHTSVLIEKIKQVQEDGFEIVDEDLTKGNLSQFDLVHYTSFNPFFQSIPFKKPAKKVVLTIHDLIPLIYPRHYQPGIKGTKNLLLNKYLIKKNIDAIITISETSKKDICRFLNVKPEKVFVIYLAPKKIFKSITGTLQLRSIQLKYKLPKEFLLYVGDVNYNKNIPGLIKASNYSKIPLVMVGKNALKIEELAQSNHPENLHLKEIMADINNKTINRLGYVPDGDLVAIYNLTSVYCQPSFYEGFGLPLLEAMACGCPVVASKIQAHTEIAENACLFADPLDPHDMGNKITQLLENDELKKHLVYKGKEVCSNYSWDKTAKDTIDVYRQIVAND